MSQLWQQVGFDLLMVAVGCVVVILILFLGKAGSPGSRDARPSFRMLRSREFTFGRRSRNGIGTEQTCGSRLLATPVRGARRVPPLTQTPGSRQYEGAS